MTLDCSYGLRGIGTATAIRNDRSHREPRTRPRLAGVPVSAMRHGRLRYEADDGSGLCDAVPLGRFGRGRQFTEFTWAGHDPIETST